MVHELDGDPPRPGAAGGGPFDGLGPQLRFVDLDEDGDLDLRSLSDDELVQQIEQASGGFRTVPTLEINGKLQGIKGQYLVWSDGRVLNVRNHIGYHVVVE